jgi:hypothetical protein
MRSRRQKLLKREMVCGLYGLGVLEILGGTS